MSSPCIRATGSARPRRRAATWREEGPWSKALHPPPLPPSLPHTSAHPAASSHKPCKALWGRVTYSKGLAARRQHRSPKRPLAPIRTALKGKRNMTLSCRRPTRLLGFVNEMQLFSFYPLVPPRELRRGVGDGVGSGRSSSRSLRRRRRQLLTPNEEQPPWAPEGGTLGKEGPMPGAPLGNRPRALRFKPGIRLDWSWRGETQTRQ